MRIALPIFIRRLRYGRTYPAFWLPYVFVYQAINRFPLFEPRVLPMSRLDGWVPFVPAFLPVYVAYIPFFWWTGSRSEDDATLNRFFYATYLQLMLSAVIWILFPVSMPRDLFYHSQVYNWADAFWRWFDAPNNCLPSLHVANCLLFIQFNWNRSWRWMSTGVALGIIASTLLVKQHYVVDVLAGLVVYAIASGCLRGFELVESTADGAAAASNVREARRTVRPWAA